MATFMNIGGWGVTKALLKIALVGACALSGVQAKVHRHAYSPRPSFVPLNPQTFGLLIYQMRHYEHPQSRYTRPLF
ncbi:hypothetical protein ASB1_13960 [Helicobacter heilmannii]|nr:hypothetical protein ASB1_13960 [Helicobacter heilmannii]